MRPRVPTSRIRIIAFLCFAGALLAQVACAPARGPSSGAAAEVAPISLAGAEAEIPEQPAPRPAGLFGLLRKKPVASDPAVPEAGLPPGPVPAAPEDPGAAPSVRQTAGSAAVTPVAFGEVIRNCGVARRELGSEVARAHGSNFRLYDTDPTSTAPRAQFLTGFSDGCARQFTAALALFGAPDVHEATRYDPQNTTPYSQVDLAYEKVKNRVCGVRRGQFCPDNRAGKLAKQAAFVTIYPNFGGPGAWVEVFLHKGQLVTYEARSR